MSARLNFAALETDDFVGRDRELALIATLLLGPLRLITLVGSGGIGKTSIAGQAVLRFQRARRVRVHWVGLARLPKDADRTAVVHELAAAIVATDFSGRPAWDAVLDALDRTDGAGRRTPALLVVDNCEHVVAAVVPILRELLARNPALTVLATSRTALGLVSERVVVIASLTPDQAMALFTRRAEIAGVSIGRPIENVAAEICRRLHYHPLAIILAAARLRYQPLLSVQRELTGTVTDQRLKWPGDRRAGVEERHRRISAVIDWSFQLCGAKERLLFERMAVFAPGFEARDGGNFRVGGGADLDAIRAICADPAENPCGAPANTRIEPGEVLAILEQLVDRSLVTLHMTAAESHYSLVESLRVYGMQTLAEHGRDEFAQLIARHRNYYRRRLVGSRDEWYGPGEIELLEWASRSWDNLASAIENSLATPESALEGLEIAVTLLAMRVPYFTGSLRQVQRWIEQTLAVTRDCAPEAAMLRSGSRAFAGFISVLQGDVAGIHDVIDHCLAESGFDQGLASALRDDPSLEHAAPAAVDLLRALELFLVQNDSRSIEVFEYARAKFGREGDTGCAEMSGMSLVGATAFYDASAAGLHLIEAHLAEAIAAGARWPIAWAKLNLAIAHYRRGRPEVTIDLVEQVLRAPGMDRDPWCALWAISIQAWALGATLEDEHGRVRERAMEIGRLLGASEKYRQTVIASDRPYEPFRVESVTAADRARNMLGDGAFRAAEAQGRALPMDSPGQVARLILHREDVMAPDAADSGDDRWANLSAAESEVAALAAAGWSNSMIAVKRGRSRKTIDAQLAAILRKLRINARTDIAAHAPPVIRAEIGRATEQKPRQYSRTMRRRET
ncbi:helix-turn-helix transcriptional regulator [Nocardia brasiliensis]|uniref:helix-turn-helix transcriptional regulator n=1 Tax=Nocardia brasiliensis TaxID=37326 RepID=UPI002455747A|nr:LuxR C-terminal-related transcriptional regulator [Nocardia brasiliensis]